MASKPDMNPEYENQRLFDSVVIQLIKELGSMPESSWPAQKRAFAEKMRVQFGHSGSDLALAMVERMLASRAEARRSGDDKDLIQETSRIKAEDPLQTPAQIRHVNRYWLNAAVNSLRIFFSALASLLMFQLLIILSSEVAQTNSSTATISNVIALVGGTLGSITVVLFTFFGDRRSHPGAPTRLRVNATTIPPIAKMGRDLIAVIPAHAYFRSVFNLLWTTFRHPLTTTFIDAFSGRILTNAARENNGSEGAESFVAASDNFESDL